MRAYSLAVIVLFSGAAWAQDGNPVLVYCDDGDIGTGEGGCAELVTALQNELTDFYLDVVLVEELVGWTGGEPHAPARIVAATRDAGAIFAVWFARAGNASGALLAMHVYDPGIDQTISRTVTTYTPSGTLNHADLAFHARMIMGASLYSDIDSIAKNESLVALAIPQERVEFFEERTEKHRSLVGIGAGYLFTGYPTEQYWFHGMVFDVSVLPLERLDLFLDLGISFLQETLSGGTDSGLLDYDVTSTQFLLGVGARYDILGHPRWVLLPEVGFHVGFSAIKVSYHGGDIHGMDDRLKVNPSLWAGVQLRVRIVPRVSVGVGLRFEYVFRYEKGYLDEESGSETVIYETSLFRFGSLATISVSI